MDLSRFDAAAIAHLGGLTFEGQGAFPAQCRVAPTWIVEPVDVFEDSHLGVVPRSTGSLPQHLRLDGFEEHFDRRVIVAIPGYTHGPPEAMLAQDFFDFVGGLRCEPPPEVEALERWVKSPVKDRIAQAALASKALISACVLKRNADWGFLFGFAQYLRGSGWTAVTKLRALPDAWLASCRVQFLLSLYEPVCGKFISV